MAQYMVYMEHAELSKTYSLQEAENEVEAVKNALLNTTLSDVQSITVARAIAVDSMTEVPMADVWTALSA